MKILGLIPARSGSKRISDKNIIDLGGYPLMNWSIFSALHSTMIDKVLVSTDSEKYRSIAIYAGADVIMRGPELAGDGIGDLEVIAHALEVKKDDGFDLVAYLRPTTPFRQSGIIDIAIKQFIEAGPAVDSLRSVEEMPESAYKCFTLSPGPLLRPIAGSMDEANQPNQAQVKTFKGNGYIDLIRAENVESGLWGERCMGFLTNGVIEIDTPDDLQFARWWWANKMSREEVRFV